MEPSPKCDCHKKKQKVNRFSFLFCFLWIWIAFVSSFDVYLTIRLEDVIKESEQNPIARAIMEYDDWNVSKFIGIKMFCTIFVLGVLTATYFFSKKHAYSIILSIALFQTILIWYLTF